MTIRLLFLPSVGSLEGELPAYQITIFIKKFVGEQNDRDATGKKVSESEVTSVLIQMTIHELYNSILTLL